MSSVFSALKGWRDVKDGKNWRTAGAAQRTKLRNEANNPFDEPRMDVLPRSAGTATTQSTFLKGPGMGVAAEWARDIQRERKELPEAEEPVEAVPHRELNIIERGIARFGMVPPKRLQGNLQPKWMFSLRARMANIGKKKRRRKPPKPVPQGASPVAINVELLPVPETVGGMLHQKTKESVKGATAGLVARIEYHRRLRAKEGPGPVEQGLRDVFLEPLVFLLRKLRLYFTAYIRVDDGFQVQVLRKREELRRGRRERETARMQTLFPDQLEGHDEDEEQEELPPVVTWRQLETLQQTIQSIVAVLSLVTIVIAVFVHELQYRGFVPPWELDCENPAADRALCSVNPSCTYSMVNTTEMRNLQVLTCFPIDHSRELIDQLKIANSGMTAWLILTVYFYYRYEANIVSLRNHVEFIDRELHSHWLYTHGLLKWFLLETIFLLIHQIPYYSTDIVINSDLFSTRPSVYSFDGIIALLMVVRGFQIWKWYRGYLFHRYNSRAFAVRLHDQPMGSVLALRVIALNNPLLLSFNVFLFVLGVGSYFYRIAESSTNPTSSLYYWDSLWFAMDTMTGLPIAEDQIEPKGQLGRFLAFCVRILGILWFCSVVAAARNSLRISSDENQALMWLKMSRLHSLVRTSAARAIQYMHIFGVYHWATLRQIRRLHHRNLKLRDFEGGGTRLEESDFDVFMKTARSRLEQRKRLVEHVEKDIDEALAVEDRDVAPEVEGVAATTKDPSPSRSKIAMAKDLRAPAAKAAAKHPAERSGLASTELLSKTGSADRSKPTSADRTPHIGSAAMTPMVMTPKAHTPKILSRRTSQTRIQLKESPASASPASVFAGAKDRAQEKTPVSGTATPVVRPGGILKGAGGLVSKRESRAGSRIMSRSGSQKHINIYDPDGTGGSGEVSISASPMMTSPMVSSSPLAASPRGAQTSPTRASGRRRESVVGFALPEDEAVSGEAFGSEEGDLVVPFRSPSTAHVHGSGFGATECVVSGVDHGTSEAFWDVGHTLRNRCASLQVSGSSFGEHSAAGVYSTTTARQAAGRSEGPGHVLGEPHRRRVAIAWAEDGGAGERVRGSRFGSGDAGSPPDKGSSIAGAGRPKVQSGRRSKAAIVGGDVNYDILLTTKEKAVLHRRRFNEQVELLLDEVQALRESSDGVLRRMGIEPVRVGFYGEPIVEEESEIAQWELDMMASLDRAERQVATLNEQLSDSVGQIMLLVQGLYSSRNKSFPPPAQTDTSQESSRATQHEVQDK